MFAKVINFLDEICVVSGIKDLFIEIQQADLSKTPADEVHLLSVLLIQAPKEMMYKCEALKLYSFVA